MVGADIGISTMNTHITAIARVDGAWAAREWVAERGATKNEWPFIERDLRGDTRKTR
jgi:hypothetical protein